MLFVHKWWYVQMVTMRIGGNDVHLFIIIGSCLTAALACSYHRGSQFMINTTRPNQTPYQLFKIQFQFFLNGAKLGTSYDWTITEPPGWKSYQDTKRQEAETKMKVFERHLKDKDQEWKEVRMKFCYYWAMLWRD